MNSPRTAFWLISALLAGACRGTPANGRHELQDSALGVTYEPTNAHPIVPEDDTTGWLVRRAAVTRLVDLPGLYGAEPRGVRREARVAWEGGMFWTTVPLVRIVERDGVVSGEVLVYWFNLPDPAAAGGPVHGEIGAPLCDRVRRDSTWSACRPARPLRIDWREVADSIAALGLWSLPGDGVALREPADHGPTDQTSVEIELREGGRYRAYRYYAPDRVGTPDAARVDAIVGYLTRVIRAAR